jgi:hypothetical protein
MHIATPDGTTLYIFGSALHSQTPQDLDVLVVYDPARVSPLTVYEQMQSTFLELRKRTGLSVHPTLLALTEALESRFLERYGCIDAAAWHWLGPPPLATKPQGGSMSPKHPREPR